MVIRQTQTSCRLFKKTNRNNSSYRRQHNRSWNNKTIWIRIHWSNHRGHFGKTKYRQKSTKQDKLANLKKVNEMMNKQGKDAQYPMI